MMIKKILVLVVIFSFFACSKSLSEKEKQEYTAKGKEIAQASFNALSSELIKQMKLGGPKQAIPFCNVQAMPITNQLSETHNVSIKRTTDKLRNAANKPTVRELELIHRYKNSEEMQHAPVVEKDDNNKIHFYAPIIIKDKCLVCHGKLGEELNVKTDSIIKTLYPNDIAIGYSEGDLRGIWSIEFEKK